MERYSAVKYDYHIAEAVPADYPAVSALHRRFDFALRDPAFITWKYERNPDGKGALIVLKNSDGDVFGTLGFIAKMVSHDEDEMLSWELSDGLLDPTVRGQNWFFRLHELGAQQIAEPIAAFPNELALKPTLKCGYTKHAQIHLWRFPVNVAAILKQDVFRDCMAARIGYRLYAALFLGRSYSSLRMRSIDRFTKDFADNGALFKNRISAAFLNWRFISNPLRQYYCYEFARPGKTIGYVVFTIEDNSLDIFDFVTNESESACLRCLADHCWGKNFRYITFPAIGLNLWKYGFLRSKRNNRFMLIKDSGFPLKGTVKLRDSDW
jgi:hypothetical protein